MPRASLAATASALLLTAACATPPGGASPTPSPTGGPVPLVSLGLPGAALAAFADAAEHRAALLGLARETLDGLGCGSATAEVGRRIRPDGTPRADAAGRLTEAAWLHEVRVADCDLTTRLNVFTVVRDGRAVSRVVTLPGTTRAGPLLQADALRSARRAAVMISGDVCARWTVVDTIAVGDAEPSAARGAHTSWTEHWTLRGCGRTVRLLALFIPDTRGTGFAFADLDRAPARAAPPPQRRA